MKPSWGQGVQVDGEEEEKKTHVIGVRRTDGTGLVGPAGSVSWHRQRKKYQARACDRATGKKPSTGLHETEEAAKLQALFLGLFACLLLGFFAELLVVQTLFFGLFAGFLLCVFACLLLGVFAGFLLGFFAELLIVQTLFFGLVEGRGTLKHKRHVCDLGRVPLSNVLVEGRGTPKHRRHVCDLGRVPLADVLVEGRGTVKHRRHVCDL